MLSWLPEAPVTIVEPALLSGVAVVSLVGTLQTMLTASVCTSSVSDGRLGVPPTGGPVEGT